jgi:hypothetical protein
MRFFQAPRHASRRTLSSRDDSHSWSSEPFAQDGPDRLASRHDPQLFSARTVPADPYKAWLQEREADRRSLIIA